jgi:hypothetical protein
MDVTDSRNDAVRAFRKGSCRFHLFDFFKLQNTRNSRKAKGHNFGAFCVIRSPFLLPAMSISLRAVRDRLKCFSKKNVTGKNGHLLGFLRFRKF